MKKHFIVVALLVLITPSIALAAWWNPFSWFKRKPITSEVVQPIENNINEQDDNSKIKEIKKSSPEKNVNKTISSDSVLGSWEFTYPAWGRVKIPSYEERIERIKAICDFIEGPMRTYYGQAMQKHAYCSFVGPHQEPSVSYDLRDLMKSSKSTIELAWDQVLAFESLKRQVLNEYVNKMKNLNPVQPVNNYKPYNGVASLDCSNYVNEKAILDSQQSQGNNIDSSYGIKQREQLKQKYSSCF